MTVRSERNPDLVTLLKQQPISATHHRPRMNSADVFSLEFDMLTRTSSLARILDRFRTTHLRSATHRKLLLDLNHVINVHSRLREVAADVVPPDDWSDWQDLLAVPALAFEQGRSFLDDL